MAFSFLAGTASAQTLYVDDDAVDGVSDGSDWCNAFVDLQDALAVAASGGVGEIRVAQGTYYPDRGGGMTSGNRLASFELVDGVTVRGGYEGIALGSDPCSSSQDWDPALFVTVLSGDIDGDGTPTLNSYHVVVARGLGGVYTLDGVVVGYGNADSATGNNSIGGGVYASQGQTTLTRCRFEQNRALDGGGALFAHSNTLSVTECQFLDNTSENGGAVQASYSTQTYTACVFARNQAVGHGGGLYADHGVATFMRCTWTENTAAKNGAGLHLAGAGVMNVAACRFERNETQQWGGGIHSEGALTVGDDTSFVDNDAVWSGAAIYNWQGSLFVSQSRFENNTAGVAGGAIINYLSTSNTITGSDFTDNSANRDGGAIMNSVSDVTIENCTLTNNRAVNHGGAIGYFESSGRVAACTFTGNSTDLYNGGAMFVSEASVLVIDGCSFAENTAGINGGALTVYGGALNVTRGSEARLTGCTFTANVVEHFGGGLAATNSFVSLKRCILRENRAGKIGGGFYHAGHDVSAEHSVFEFNQAGEHGGGISTGAGTLFATNCVIAKNSAQQFGGGLYLLSGTASLWLSTVYGNTARDAVGGVYAASGANPANMSVVNSVIWGNVEDNDRGEETQLSGATHVSHSCIQNLVSSWDHTTGDDPQLADPASGDYRLTCGSPCIDGGTNIISVSEDLDRNARPIDDPFTVDSGTGTAPLIDMGAYEFHGLPVIYVDLDAAGADDGKNWADAYADLQDALNEARACQEVWVAEGEYVPGPHRASRFKLPDNVSVYGGFEGTESSRNQRNWEDHETVLTCDIDGDDDRWQNREENCYHVVTSVDVSAGTTLDGFTITGGEADGEGWFSRGAGIYNGNGSPTIRNCYLFRNHAITNGGGMLNTEGAAPTISHCTFHGNGADQRGGAIRNFRTAVPWITNCNFCDNLAEMKGGAISNYDSKPMIANSLFHFNHTSGTGGAVECAGGSDLSIVNCTMFLNQASGGGSSVAVTQSSPTIRNSILRGHSLDQISVSGGSPSVMYCNIEGGWTGATSFDRNPYFVDDRGPDGFWGTCDEDFSLQSNSPCIDAGDDEAVPVDQADVDRNGDREEATPLDLADHQRVYGSRVDIGAYEFFPFANEDVSIIDSFPPDGAIMAAQPTSLDGGEVFGLNRVLIVVDLPLNNADGADFGVTVEINPDYPDPLVGAPRVISVEILIPIGDEGPTYVVTLDGPIPPGAWTRLTYLPSQSSIRIGYLPGDVNGDGISSAQDILTLVDFLNGSHEGLGDWSTDIDRSGDTRPADILRLIDLLNGAGAFQVWIGRSLP